MNIINKIQHESLGEIWCIGDKKNNPLYWMKKDFLSLFSNKAEEVKVYFDFACYNKLFKYEERYKSIALEMNKSISKVYKFLIKNVKKIEDDFFAYYRRETQYDLEEWEEEENIKLVRLNNKEDLYKYIKTVEIRIYEDGFSIIIKTPWDKEDWGYSKREIFREDGGWESLNQESEVDPVEMDYDS